MKVVNYYICIIHYMCIIYVLEAVCVDMCCVVLVWYSNVFLLIYFCLNCLFVCCLLTFSKPFSWHYSPSQILSTFCSLLLRWSSRSAWYLHPFYRSLSRRFRKLFAWQRQMKYEITFIKVRAITIMIILGLKTKLFSLEYYKIMLEIHSAM